MTSDDEHVRQLEDACLALWDRMTSDQFIHLRRDLPDLADFLAHLNHSIPHEEAMVRRNVWSRRESV
jgi:hypothetical protein